MTTSDDSATADDIRRAMTELAANFATHTELDPILQAVTTQAVRLIGEADFADILILDDSGHRSMTPTAPLTAELNSIGVELQEGPCILAATGESMVHCANLETEERWPQFAAAATAMGIGSMMSFHLHTQSAKTRGGVKGGAALNLFSLNVNPFTPADQVLGAMLATHAATALIAANRQLQFDAALSSRDVLGQAKGILMERLKVDAVRAFNLMAKLSQETNTPVRTVARQIIDNS